MYGYGYTPTEEQIKAQQEAQKQRIKDKHDEKLESLPDGGMGGPGEGPRAGVENADGEGPPALPHHELLACAAAGANCRRR